MAKKKSQKIIPPTAQQLRKHSLDLIKNTCDRMVGPGYFNKFSPFLLDMLLRFRHNALKLKQAVNSGLDKDNFTILSTQFIQILHKMDGKTLTGETWSLPVLLREGVLLARCIQSTNGKPALVDQSVYEAFRPYFKPNEYFINLFQIPTSLVFRMSLIVSNWSTKMLVIDTSTIALLGSGTENEITVKLERTQSCTAKIEDKNREILRVGWSGYMGEFEWVQISAEAMGLKFNEPTKKLDVYIQHHAIQQLKNRLNLLQGYVQWRIYDMLADGKIKYHKLREKSLVELHLLGKKLGYLVCIIAEGKIIIQTFLFLTNNDTPEGNKLNQLTKLKLLDKKYLEIDTLQGFSGYNIGENPNLASLFTEAGCQELFDLTGLKRLSINAIEEKSAESLMRYLQVIDLNTDIPR